MKFVTMTDKVKLPDSFFVEAKVGIGPIAQGFCINVKIDVSLEGMDRTAAEALVHKAHQICPYSNATRGNIEVDIQVHC